jgi:glutathione S-transferase
MSAPVLHNFDLDEDCYRVRLLAALTGQTLEIRNVNVVPGGEERTPAYLALNPLGRLPILEDGDLRLTQTGAILRHLAARDPERRFLPDEPATRARMDDWMCFADRDLPVAARARAAAVLEAPGDLDALRAGAAAMLRLLDDHMTRQRIRGEGFVAGAGPTLADIALFPAFALSRDFNVDHDAFPALRLWARGVMALPGFAPMPGIPAYH